MVLTCTANCVCVFLGKAKASLNGGAFVIFGDRKFTIYIWVEVVYI